MGIRTPDLLIANETLYQLSYTPNFLARVGLAGFAASFGKPGSPPALPPLNFFEQARKR